MNEIAVFLPIYLVVGFWAAIALAYSEPDDGTYGWALAETLVIFFWPVFVGVVIIPKVLVLPGKLVGRIARRLAGD